MPDSWIWNPSVECMPRQELEKLKLERLKAVVKRMYEESKYYREKMKQAGVTPDDVKTLDDLRKLPLTTKQDLRNLYPYGALLTSLSEVVEIHASSGTTGKPTVAPYTARDIENWSEIMARCLASGGLTKNDVLHICFNYHMFTGGLGFHYGALKIGAAIIPAGGGYTQRQVMMIKDFGATMLACVPNYALRLAEVAMEMGIDPARDTKVRKGMFGAEMWSEELRRRIEKIWDMEAYDIYGMSELYGPGVAVECPMHNGLHVWEDYYIVEVIDPKTGEPVEPEEKGELVFTTLTKEGMPLVRYRTGDVSRILDVKGCDCGRTHVRIDRIQGRVDDMFIVNGVNVWPSAVEQVLLREPLVAPFYQIILDREGTMDKMIVVVEAAKKLTDEEKEALAKKLQYDLRENILVTPKVEVVDPGTLPRIEGGKAKRVIDRRS